MVCTPWRWRRKSCAQWAARSRRYLWPTLYPEPRFTFAPSSQSCFLPLLPRVSGKGWRQKRKINVAQFFPLLLIWKEFMFQMSVISASRYGWNKAGGLNKHEAADVSVIHNHWQPFIHGTSPLGLVNMTRCYFLPYSSMGEIPQGTLSLS